MQCPMHSVLFHCISMHSAVIPTLLKIKDGFTACHKRAIFGSTKNHLFIMWRTFFHHKGEMLWNHLDKKRFFCEAPLFLRVHFGLGVTFLFFYGFGTLCAIISFYIHCRCCDGALGMQLNSVQTFPFAASKVTLTSLCRHHQNESNRQGVTSRTSLLILSAWTAHD